MQKEKEHIMLMQVLSLQMVEYYVVFPFCLIRCWWTSDDKCKEFLKLMQT